MAGAPYITLVVLTAKAHHPFEEAKERFREFEKEREEKKERGKERRGGL